MDQHDSQQQPELRNLIQFAFFQRKFKEAIKLAEDYLQLFPQSKNIYMKKALAHSEIDQPDKCLQNLSKAQELGVTLKQTYSLKIRSLIQLGLTQQAQKQMQILLNQDPETKKIIQLSNAIKIIKSSSQKLNQNETELEIIEDMNKWLKSSGAQYNKITITNISSTYRGVIAVKHIKRGQRIIYIPKSELISLQMAKNHKNIIPLIEKKVKLLSPKHSYLSILLLILKGTPNSKFKPYIDLLPQDHSSFPINFSKQQLLMLEGSSFIKMIYQKVIDLKKDYEAIVKTDPELYKFSFKQFCWARMMIGSRIFGINISGLKTEVLVPFADMLNHRQPKQTVWNYEESLNGFAIESLQDIEVGQQVFDSYGRKCNSRFLLNYGFVLQQNIDNEISMRLALSPDDPLQKVKKQMLKIPALHHYVEIKKININMNNNKFYQYMGTLRFICVDELQTINMLKKISNIEVTNQPYIIFRTPPISIKNQIKIWETFALEIGSMLKSYPNLIQKDKQLLRKQKLTQNQRNIIIIRMGQKQILHQYEKICEQVISVLKSNNIIQAIQAKINKSYSKYLYKILSLTPGVNKKELQKKVGVLFQHYDEVNNQQIQEVPEN